MPDPTPEDVARSVARRFCGWHVTPVLTDHVVTLDGPGSALLVLPTLQLVELTGVVEDGVELDVADLFVSARGLVRKKSGAWWSRNYGAIVVTMTHGFPDAAGLEEGAIDYAQGFNAAVTSYAERSDGAQPRVVGPFQWETTAMDAASTFTVAERSLLEQYRLESAP